MLFRFHSKEKDRERGRACARHGCEREWGKKKKNILLYKGCSLSVCTAKGKRSSPFSITRGFLILAFPHASSLKPPIRACHPQRGRCRVHFFHRSPRTHVETTLEDPAAKATHFSPLIMMSGRRKLRAKIQINKTSRTCSFHIYIPLNKCVRSLFRYMSELGSNKATRGQKETHGPTAAL